MVTCKHCGCIMFPNGLYPWHGCINYFRHLHIEHDTGHFDGSFTIGHKRRMAQQRAAAAQQIKTEKARTADHVNWLAYDMGLDHFAALRHAYSKEFCKQLEFVAGIFASPGNSGLLGGAPMTGCGPIPLNSPHKWAPDEIVVPCDVEPHAD